MEEAALDAEFARNELARETGTNKHGDMRRLGVMPVRLEMALKVLYPEGYPVDNVKFHRTFFRKYPQLRIAKKI